MDSGLDKGWKVKSRDPQECTRKYHFKAYKVPLSNNIVSFSLFCDYPRRCTRLLIKRARHRHPHQPPSIRRPKMTAAGQIPRRHSGRIWRIAGHSLRDSSFLSEQLRNCQLHQRRYSRDHFICRLVKKANCLSETCWASERLIY